MGLQKLFPSFKMDSNIAYVFQSWVHHGFIKELNNNLLHIFSFAFPDLIKSCEDPFHFFIARFFLLPF